MAVLDTSRAVGRPLLVGPPAGGFTARLATSRRSGMGLLSLPSPPKEERAWSLDILEGPTWAKGPRFYQAAAAWTMVWQVAGALPVAKVIGWSASCLRKSVTKSRHEGRLAPRRH